MKVNENTRNKTQKMHDILTEINDGVNSANGVLSRLWRILLSKKKMTGYKWEVLFAEWAKKNEMIFNDKSAKSKRNNLPKALAKDYMTWKVFLQGLQIINSTGEYESLRFEVQMKRKNSKVVDIIGLNVVDKTLESINIPDDVDIVELSPGKDTVPGTVYHLTGFDNPKFNDRIMMRVGECVLTTLADRFDGCYLYGDTMIEADGMLSLDWVRYRPETDVS